MKRLRAAGFFGARVSHWVARLVVEYPCSTPKRRGRRRGTAPLRLYNRGCKRGVFVGAHGCGGEARLAPTHRATFCVFCGAFVPSVVFLRHSPKIVVHGGIGASAPLSKGARHASPLPTVQPSVFSVALLCLLWFSCAIPQKPWFMGALTLLRRFPRGRGTPRPYPPCSLLWFSCAIPPKPWFMGHWRFSAAFQGGEARLAPTHRAAFCVFCGASVPSVVFLRHFPKTVVHGGIGASAPLSKGARRASPLPYPPCTLLCFLWRFCAFCGFPAPFPKNRGSWGIGAPASLSKGARHASPLPTVQPSVFSVALLCLLWFSCAIPQKPWFMGALALQRRFPRGRGTPRPYPTHRATFCVFCGASVPSVVFLRHSPKTVVHGGIGAPASLSKGVRHASPLPTLPPSVFSVAFLCFLCFPAPLSNAAGGAFAVPQREMVTFTTLPLASRVTRSTWRCLMPPAAISLLTMTTLRARRFSPSPWPLAVVLSRASAK